MNKSKNLITGLIIICIACFLLVSQLGLLKDFTLFNDIGFFQVVFGILLIIFFIDALFKLKFGQLFFSTAFFIIVFDEELHLTSITPWTVLISALLITIGITIIFPKKKRYHRFSDNSTTVDGEKLYFKTSFGDETKYIKSNNFSYGDFSCSFGDLNVYFNDAEMLTNRARINVDVKFGDMDIFVPKDWNIVCNVNSSFGDVNTKGDNIITSPEKTLEITGGVHFGDLLITHI